MQVMGKPILIVEDSRTYAVMLRSTLERLGRVVEHVMTLNGAMAMLNARAYDVVLFDLFLPDSDGIQGLERVLEITDAPVIVLTALEDESTARAALRAGADDYIFKGALDQTILWRTLGRATERQFFRLKQRERFAIKPSRPNGGETVRSVELRNDDVRVHKDTQHAAPQSDDD